MSLLSACTWPKSLDVWLCSGVIFERAKKIAQLLGVKSVNVRRSSRLWRYEDGEYETVPTAVIADHADKIGLP